MMGESNTCKSLLGKIIATLFGYYSSPSDIELSKKYLKNPTINCCKKDINQLQHNFNSDLIGKLWILVDEFMCEKATSTNMTCLKDRIDTDTMIFEEKFGAKRELYNTADFYITTNNEYWNVYGEGWEKRAAVFFANSKMLTKWTQEKINKLMEELYSGGFSDIMYQLINDDSIPNKAPLPPKNKTKGEVKMNHYYENAPILPDLLEMFETKNSDFFEVIEIRKGTFRIKLRSEFINATIRNKHPNVIITNQTVTKVINGMGQPLILSEQHFSNGKNQRVKYLPSTMKDFIDALCKKLNKVPLNNTYEIDKDLQLRTLQIPQTPVVSTKEL
jgi:hypothetical protein